MLNAPSWKITITHEPTGEAITLDSFHFRSKYKAKEDGIKVIRSRLYAKKIHLEEKEVAKYDLPDNDLFPKELSDYRIDEFNGGKEMDGKIKKLEPVFNVLERRGIDRNKIVKSRLFCIYLDMYCDEKLSADRIIEIATRININGKYNSVQHMEA